MAVESALASAFGWTIRVIENENMAIPGVDISNKRKPGWGMEEDDHLPSRADEPKRKRLLVDLKAYLPQSTEHSS